MIDLILWATATAYQKWRSKSAVVKEGSIADFRLVKEMVEALKQNNVHVLLKVLPGNVVESPVDRPLELRPGTLDGIGVNRPIHVLLLFVQDFVVFEVPVL